MSVKWGLMALLAEGPSYGAQLRSEFEHRTGNAWPLNVGQIYTTLGRLERDGLVVQLGTDAEGKVAYELTELGRQEIAGWWDSPVDRETSPRSELVIKMALAVVSPGVDVARVVHTQRAATLAVMRELVTKRRSMQPTNSDEVAALLVLENQIFHVESEARWLDHIETIIAKHRNVLSHNVLSN